jgi:D-aminopeptidase
MVVLATDAPLSCRQLERLCRRAVAGLVNVGSRLENGSGDFVIAFSTSSRVSHVATALTAQQTAIADEARVLNALFRAAIESVEEAVLNSLCAAETMVGRDGHTAHALPLDQVQELMLIHH